MAQMPLAQTYKDQIVPQLMEQFSYENTLQVPRVEKIVVNCGVGTAHDREVLQEAADTLAAITGQRPITTRAKKSISNFKLRAGMPIGVCVTLRGAKLYNFLYRLINIVLPRVRDFRGVSGKSFDGHGNYTMGLTDQSVFTEINLDNAKHTIGMDISIVTSAENDEKGKALLALMGMPFA